MLLPDPAGPVTSCTKHLPMLMICIDVDDDMMVGLKVIDWLLNS